VNICKLASLSRSRILTLSLSNPQPLPFIALVSMKIVAIVPHENSSCASPKSRDEINLNEINRARNSLLHVQRNAPCTRSADYPVAFATCHAHVWLERQSTRKTRRTSFTHEASARPLSTMRRLKKPTATRIYAQITRKYSMYFHHKDPEMANMLRNTSSACVSDTSLTCTLQLAVQICEANCCACIADVRMAAALVEFDCATTCPTT